MASVAELVEPEALRERAGEYLARAGEVIRTSGRVRLVELTATRVTAEVEDGPVRSVALEAGPTGLAATCDCGAPSGNGLCPHVVAVARETWERSSSRR